MRIGIGDSEEGWWRVIRWRRQVLNQDPKLSVNVFADDRPAQRGSGEYPAVTVKIALSRSIISATMGETCLSKGYSSKDDPQFQQDASADKVFVIAGIVMGSRGSSVKQTVHLSSRGVRCRAQ